MSGVDDRDRRDREALTQDLPGWALEPGQVLGGRYEIRALLGRGGMGEVYRARDTRLDREVAIKVLPTELAADPERFKRFEREAKATAALSHPNILAVHDVGSAQPEFRAEGEETRSADAVVHFLVEELLEGESLRERLAGGAIPVGEAVAIAAQVVRGLAAAHDKGIVHRDLKPENVFLTREGTVKILDFGLAKLVELAPSEADTLTHAPTGATELGRVLGTTAYMSPEQARGRPVDPRTDIFSFGCVLYEMLAGQRPFRGETATDTVAAILMAEPPALPETVPPALRAVVIRCLAKRPDQRFSSAHDLALALQAASQAPPSAILKPVPRLRRRWLVIGAVAAAAVLLPLTAALVFRIAVPGHEPRAARPPKIVVLPFENLGSPEDAYFAAGMADEITSRLANVQGLGVISRTTAIHYDRTGKTVKQIGSDLGVDYVLEGSVRWEHGQGKESRVRITPQLIRVADDTHVWADRYDRVLADVFAMQSEVAESTVGAMGVKLLPRERTALKEISTNDLEAYDLYLRGLELVGRGESCEIFGSALEKFQAAVDRDPGFAQALAMTATMHLLMSWIHCDQGHEHLVKGKEAAERAIELRPDIAEAHVALAEYFYRGLRDYPRALEEYATARRIQPGSGLGYLGTGFILRRQGRVQEALEAFEKGLELDPKNVHLLYHLAGCYFWSGRYADADRALERAIALSPQWSWPYQLRANLYVHWHGDVDGAQAILEEASHVAGMKESFLSTRRWLALLRGDYPAALRLLDAWDQQVVNAPDELAYHSLLRAQVQTLMGQGDLARRSYEAARVELERLIQRDANDARLHGSLGIAYAGIGRRADAVREARRGCDLQPVSDDALAYQDRLWDLAQVFTMVGQPAEAIAILDDCMSRSGLFSVHVLRLDPTWDPLRSDPRFQALLTKYEVQE